MPKESYLPPLLIFPKKKEKKNAEGTAAPYFSAKKLRNNYKLRIRGSTFLEESPFQRVPFSVPALIFEPIKL